MKDITLEDLQQITAATQTEIRETTTRHIVTSAELDRDREAMYAAQRVFYMKREDRVPGSGVA